MQTSNKWYQEIANGIVLQAVADYRRALKGKGCVDGKCYIPPEDVIKDVERFFRSHYFRILTKVNGEYLIEKLRKEHEEKVGKAECTLN